MMIKLGRIVRDPEICGGQPTINGTRVLVLDIMNWIEEGYSFEKIIENYPSITKEDIQDIIRYAKSVIAGESIVFGQSH